MRPAAIFRASAYDCQTAAQHAATHSSPIKTAFSEAQPNADAYGRTLSREMRIRARSLHPRNTDVIANRRDGIRRSRSAQHRSRYIHMSDRHSRNCAQSCGKHACAFEPTHSHAETVIDIEIRAMRWFRKMAAMRTTHSALRPAHRRTVHPHDCEMLMAAIAATGHHRWL